MLFGLRDETRVRAYASDSKRPASALAAPLHSDPYQKADVTQTYDDSFDDPASVRRFAQQHYGKALSFIAALHYNPADTDGAVSGVLADAIGRADERQPGEDWDRFVGTLAAQRVRRELANRQQGPLLDYYRHLASHMVDDEATAAYFRSLRSRFSSCVKQVNRTEFEALKLRYGQGLDIEAVARRSGRPVAAVRRGLRRIRLRLAECMHGRELTDDSEITPIQALTLRYLDGDLSQRELDEMQWRVAQDPAERDKHIALLELETLLTTMARRADAVAEQVVQRLRADELDPSAPVPTQTVDPELAAVAEASASTGTTGRGRRTSRRNPAQTTLQLTLLALLLAGLGAATWVYRDQLTFHEAPEPTASATVVDREGKITYERDGTSYLLRPTTVLQPGDVVHVRDDATLVLAFDGAGRFNIGPGSSVRIERGQPQAAGASPRPRLALVTGAVDADLAPADREAPVRLYTPHADVRADDARFTVRAEAARTRVTVAAGSVTARRRADNKQVDLAAGQAVLVAPGEPMTPALAENFGNVIAPRPNASVDAAAPPDRTGKDEAEAGDAPAPSSTARGAADGEREEAPAGERAADMPADAEAGETANPSDAETEESADEAIPDGGANAIHAREAFEPPLTRR